MPKRKSTRRNRKGKSHLQSLDTYRRCQESLILDPKISTKASTGSRHLTTGQKAFMSVLIMGALMMPIIEAKSIPLRSTKMPKYPKLGVGRFNPILPTPYPIPPCIPSKPICIPDPFSGKGKICVTPKPICGYPRGNRRWGLDKACLIQASTSKNNQGQGEDMAAAVNLGL